ncbi:uncharacterized protein DUF4019 [Collimonas sp. PA-H2]|uniref:DUF4019 domain-containing protein n=1 Tax=Collimonas sp. PA-H2 TaxID=1881062 RepID=UPI000BFA69FB|nr:DUF4019 domain-containing protein [Collimonas sp. PA-H2]PFH08053.1 uncharacterized protein DUF4019 [Collimonas sp. PA-H2]
MARALQITSLKSGLLRQMACCFGKASIFAKLALMFLSMAIATYAAAQSPSADAAIDAALQWLKLADTGQIDKMWEQSDPLMKSKSEQTAWIKYVGNMRSQLGPPPELRTWQAMEHQIDNPSLPRGEFASVTFLSRYSNVPTWEKVSLVWSSEHWTPVGYQSGLIAAAEKK